MPGLFIVLDGPDGTGTTTHAKSLAERLQKEGHDVLLTAEPTSGPIGTWIRSQLKEDGDLTPLSLQLMFCADRAWHIDTVITPALDAGKIVICDRYAPSTMIYAASQGLETQMLQKLNNSFIQPDCLLFTLPPLETSLERIASREEKDMFDAKELQKRIHDGYKSMAEDNSSIQTIDTSQNKQDATEQVYEIVRPLLPKRPA